MKPINTVLPAYEKIYGEQRRNITGILGKFVRKIMTSTQMNVEASVESESVSSLPRQSAVRNDIFSIDPLQKRRSTS